MHAADGSVHFTAPANSKIHFENKTRHNLGLAVSSIDVGSIKDAASATRITFDQSSTSNRTTLTSGDELVLTGVTVTGLAPESLSSSNGYASLDAEIDQLQTNLNTTLNRTQGQTVGKVLKASAGGILVSGTKTEANLVENHVANTLTGTTTFEGTATLGSGVSASQVLTTDTDKQVQSQVLAFSDLTNDLNVNDLPELLFSDLINDMQAGDVRLISPARTPRRPTWLRTLPPRSSVIPTPT